MRTAREQAQRHLPVLMHKLSASGRVAGKSERIAVTLASEVGETRREELVEAMNRHMDEAKLLLAWGRGIRLTT